MEKIERKEIEREKKCLSDGLHVPEAAPPSTTTKGSFAIATTIAAAGANCEK